MQTCHISDWHVKIKGRSALLPPCVMPVLIMDYSTRHRCIQSAILSPCRTNWRLCEISIRSAQCKNCSSEAFLGIMNINATNALDKSQYFVDRSGCIKKDLKQIEIEIGMTIDQSVDSLPTYAYGVTVTFSMVTFQWRNVSIILLKLYPHIIQKSIPHWNSARSLQPNIKIHQHCNFRH